MRSSRKLCLYNRSWSCPHTLSQYAQLMLMPFADKASVLAESGDIRHLAQRAFASYVRSVLSRAFQLEVRERPGEGCEFFCQVRLMKDKDIFDFQVREGESLRQR